MRRKILWTLAVLVLLGVYPLIRFALLATAAAEVTQDLGQLQQQLQRPQLNDKAVGAKLDQLAAHTVAASTSANDPLLTPLKWLPVVGHRFDQLAQATDALSQLAVAGQAVYHDGFALKSQHNQGAFQAKTVTDLRTHFAQLQDATALTQNQVKSLGKEQLGLGLDQPLAKAKAVAQSAQSAVEQLAPMVNTFAALFENPSPKTWFIATQNLAESRGTGGIIGSYAIIQTSNGHLTLLETGSDQDLAKLGPVRSPLMTSEYANFWGIDAKIWQDLNAGGNTPTAGQIIVDSWRNATGQRLNGVVFMGQGTTAHLLGLTGPITVAGKTLDHQNAAEYLAKGIYADHSSVEKKNQFVRNFAAATFKALLTQQPDVRGLLASLTGPQQGDQLLVYSTDASQQQRLEQQGLAGQIGQNAGSRVWLTLNNAGGNKLEAYLQTSAVYRLSTCGTKNVNGLPSRKASLTVNLQNRAPATGLPAYVTSRSDKNWSANFVPGTNRELVTVYAPTGATDDGIYLNGHRVAAHFGMDGKHPIYQLTVTLAPGQSSTMTFNWDEPTQTTGGHQLAVTPQLHVPPSYNRIKASVETSGFCSTN